MMVKVIPTLISLTFICSFISGCARVDSGVEVTFNDSRLVPLLSALERVNRDSLGFAPLDPYARITYKEEYKGTLIKLFFEKPDYLTILYFRKNNNDIVYSMESETTKGPRKLIVKDADGYRSIIQETIHIKYDRDRTDRFGPLRVRYLDLDKYPDKEPYDEESSIHHPRVIYETEISMEQAKEVLARWGVHR